MKNSRSFTLLAVALFLIELSVHSQRKSFFEFSIGYRPTPKLVLSGFPPAYRAIPRHHDDNWLMYAPLANNTLADDTLTMPSSFAFDLTLAFSHSPILLGIVFSLQSGSTGDSTIHFRHSQNQYGTDDRGYGTSLRWYEPNIAQTQFGVIMGLKSPWCKISEKVGWRVETGYVRDLTGVGILMKSGYDRYSKKDEAYQTNRIGAMKVHLLFGSLEIGALTESEEIENQRMYIRIRFLRPFYEFTSEQQIEPVKIHNKIRALPLSIAVGLTF